MINIQLWRKTVHSAFLVCGCAKHVVVSIFLEWSLHHTGHTGSHRVLSTGAGVNDPFSWSFVLQYTVNTGGCPESERLSHDDEHSPCRRTCNHKRNRSYWNGCTHFDELATTWPFWTLCRSFHSNTLTSHSACKSSPCLDFASRSRGYIWLSAHK